MNLVSFRFELYSEETGKVKFIEGAWWIDNEKNAIRLWNNECAENYIASR